MQTFLAILIVLSAVAYVTWQWMPLTWRNVFLMSRSTAYIGVPDPGQKRLGTSSCSACSTCGACSPAQLGS